MLRLVDEMITDLKLRLFSECHYSANVMKDPLLRNCIVNVLRAHVVLSCSLLHSADFWCCGSVCCKCIYMGWV